MPLDPPVMTATLPSSFPITSPLVVSGQHLPPRPSTWVCRRQALSAESRTSVVRNRSGWTTDASRDDRCPPFGIGPCLSACAVMTARATHMRDDVRWFWTRLWKAQPAVPAFTMIDWNDVLSFLAVAPGGSVRAAAERLGVNHSTVLRRIAQLEERLGVQMFEKLPAGYRLTEAGEEVLEFAEQMEASSHSLETRVFGRDQSVRGLLRVTLAPPLATHLLMPDFADFAHLHPDIEMEIS